MTDSVAPGCSDRKVSLTHSAFYLKNLQPGGCKMGD